MIHLIALLVMKGGTHAAVTHTAAAHAVAVNTAAAHTAAAHTAASHAGHAIAAGVAIDATTIGGVSFLRYYNKQVDTLTAQTSRPPSRAELREIRDSSYQKVRVLMGASFTPAEQAELNRICAQLGV
jgi:membrane-bound lytic murein transglycosylase B